MLATQATRSAGSGTSPITTRSGCWTSTGPASGTRLPARATRTTASDCRRQKSRQAGSPPAATPSATSTTRSPASSALARPSASTTPGSTTVRWVASRSFRWCATSSLPLPACRPTTATTWGRAGRSRVERVPAVRIWPATWVRTVRAARGSRSSSASKAARGTSMRLASRRARTPADRGSPVSSDSSPTTAPGVSVRSSRSPWTTSRRPLRSRYADPGGSPSRTSHSPASRSSRPLASARATRASSESAATSGMSPRPIDDAVRIGSGARNSASGSSSSGEPCSTSSSSERAATLPIGRATSATRTNATIDSIQPSRRAATTPGPVGLPTIRTRIETPSTPPSCRALETRADAVAYRPPGTAARAALPSSGRVAPTPMPDRTWPGSHSAQKAGSRPTIWWYQR